jgi:TolB-like protein
VWSHSDQKARSVAVLPFVNLTAGPRLDCLGDRIATDIKCILQFDPRLTPVDAAPATWAGGPDVHVGDLGRQLHADLLLFGDVRREGQGIRATARLIDASTGCTQWRGACGSGWVLCSALEVATRIAEGVRRALGRASGPG